jgi:hypothetical protein
VQTGPSALPLRCGSPWRSGNDQHWRPALCKVRLLEQLKRQGRWGVQPGDNRPRSVTGGALRTVVAGSDQPLPQHGKASTQLQPTHPHQLRDGKLPRKARGLVDKRGVPRWAPSSPWPGSRKRKRKGASSYRGTARRPILAFFSVGEKSRLHRNTSKRRASMAILAICRGGDDPVRAANPCRFARRTSEVGKDLRKKDCIAWLAAELKLGWAGREGRAAAAPCGSVAGAIQFVEQLARAVQVPGETGVVNAQGCALQGHLRRG